MKIGKNGEYRMKPSYQIILSAVTNGLIEATSMKDVTITDVRVIARLIYRNLRKTRLI